MVAETAPGQGSEETKYVHLTYEQKTEALSSPEVREKIDALLTEAKESALSHYQFRYVDIPRADSALDEKREELYRAIVELADTCTNESLAGALRSAAQMHTSAGTYVAIEGGSRQTMQLLAEVERALPTMREKISEVRNMAEYLARDAHDTLEQIYADGENTPAAFGQKYRHNGSEVEQLLHRKLGEITPQAKVDPNEAGLLMLEKAYEEAQTATFSGEIEKVLHDRLLEEVSGWYGDETENRDEIVTRTVERLYEQEVGILRSNIAARVEAIVRRLREEMEKKR